MSEPIWLLSTRGRPKACQEVLDACEAMGMTSPGVVYVDETVDEYRGIRLPKNWTIHYEPVWGSLSASMQWCFKNYPDASSYGWLADDTYPRTQGWDKKVEKEAGAWNLAFCNDLWLSVGNPELVGDLTSGLCWGGELVRTVGWWALPGVIQAGIDTAWLDLCAPLNRLRYLPDVVVEHKNWRTKKRDWDETDNWERDGKDYVSRDVWIHDTWVGSKEFLDTLSGIAAVCPRDSIIGQRWGRVYREKRKTDVGPPAARLEAELNAKDARKYAL